MLVVDAGPLSLRPAHAIGITSACRAVEHRSSSLIVPALVIAEVAYFLADRLGERAEQAFARSLRDGELYAEPVSASDGPGSLSCSGSTRDLPLGIVDASVVATCERLDVSTLATLDRRHFSVVWPRHQDALILLPE